MIPKGRLLKYIVLGVSWLACTGLLFILSANNDISPVGQKASLPTVFDSPSNQIGAFRFVRYHPENDNKPGFSLSFDGLLVENNTLGIFKSALHQAVRIRNLDFKIYRHPQNNSADDAVICPEATKQDMFLRDSVFPQLKDLVVMFLNSQNGWRVNWDIASANITELSVNNFSYTVFSGDVLVLSVQSKRAEASYSSSGPVLRGHVIVKAASGNILEANHVKWDIDSSIFTIKGIYSLKSDGTVKMGRDITLDRTLNEFVQKQTVEANRKEEPECFAKL